MKMPRVDTKVIKRWLSNKDLMKPLVDKTGGFCILINDGEMADLLTF